jgi:hypothetical protein
MSTSIHYDQFEKLEKEMTDATDSTTEMLNDSFFRSDPHFTPKKTKSTVSVTYTKIDYKYNEGELIDQIKAYVDATYNQHYSRNKFQSTEFIIDCGHGTGFNIGNMMKYTQRYGRKGDREEWRKDLMKVIHYTIMQLYVHDLETKRINYGY